MAVENVRNWEWNKAKLEVRFLPAFLAFLGYDPTTTGSLFHEALRHARRAEGLSQANLAAHIGFDERTIAKWERGRDKRPLPANLDRFRRFFEQQDRASPGFESDRAYSQRSAPRLPGEVIPGNDVVLSSWRMCDLRHLRLSHVLPQIG